MRVPRLVERDGWVRGMRELERYYWLKARGLCTQCGAPAGPKTLCPECLATKRVEAKRLKDERRARGLCPQCGGERQDARYRMCEKCRAYHAGYNRRRYHERNEGAKTYDRQS